MTAQNGEGADRLARIRDRWETSREAAMWTTDLPWLISEVERLRELVAHASRSDLMSDRCDACRDIRKVVASL